MGKKIDILLGRTFKTSKFKVLAKLSVSRIAILKNHRRARCSHARSDIVELLKLGQHENALLRVEHVIKEQNILDVLDMIESYCHLLTERVKIIQNKKECPEELKEPISSLLYAAVRCGEFPELQEIRKMFASWFGNDFALGAAESHNNFGVNRKMMHELSTRTPSLETKNKILVEISLANGIILDTKKDAYAENQPETREGKGEPLNATTVDPQSITKEESETDGRRKHSETNQVATLDEHVLGSETHDFHDVMEREDKFRESGEAKRKYKDVSHAAQEAFESAAYAAEAARVAVELSRYESQHHYPDIHNGSSHHSHGRS